jgi:hypothetical protein
MVHDHSIDFRRTFMFHGDTVIPLPVGRTEHTFSRIHGWDLSLLFDGERRQGQLDGNVFFSLACTGKLSALAFMVSDRRSDCQSLAVSVRSCIHFRKAGRQGWGPYLPEHEIKSGELLIFMIGWAMVLEGAYRP